MAKMTLKKYREMVDERGQFLLDAIASLATGDLNLEDFDIPDGIEILSDVAMGLRILAEDFQELLQEHERVEQELEDRVAARTEELERALADLQFTQSRYLHDQWDGYLKQDSENGDYLLVEEDLAPMMVRAVDVKKPVMDVVAEGKAGLAVPVQYADELIGIMGFTREEMEVWSDEEVTAVVDVVEQVGLALENQRLFDQTQTALSETASLYQGSTDINTAQNFDDILKALRQHTILGKKTINVSINVFDRPWIGNDMPTWSIVLTRWTELEEDTLLERYRLQDFPLAKTLLSDSTPTIVEDVPNDSRLDEQTRALYHKVLKAESTIFIPLVAGNQWIGYVNGVYPQHTQFAEDDIRRLTALGRQAAVAIQGIQLLDQTQQQLADLTTIQQTTSGLTQALTLEEAVNILILQVVEAAQIDIVSLYRLIGNELFRIGTHPLPEDGQIESVYSMDDFPIIKSVIETRTAQVVTANDPNLSPESKALFKQAGITANATVPIIGQRGIFGVLFANSLSNETFTQQDLGLLQTLADQAIIAFERVQLLEETRRKAEREQVLREIAAKVRGSTDIETIMRTAVQEVGQRLGRKAYVHLGQGTPIQSQEDA